MDKQQIIEMIATHGKKNYYDQATNRTYLLSEMNYHLFHNKTYIPFIDFNTDNDGQIELEGNYETMA